MPWCPNCKLEYVEGIKICPDCKTALVDSLDDIASEEEFDFSDEYNAADEQMEDALSAYFPELSNEERCEMLDNFKQGAMIPKYKSRQDAYSENKSGAFSLILVGVLGVLFVALNSLKIISLPIAGFSSTLTNVVMGVLFLIFLLSGIFSAIKASKLKPSAAAEKELIDKIVEFVRTQKKAGLYKVQKEGDNFEFDYIKLTDTVVKDIENNFEELEPGFAYYVVDRFASDVLDED